MSASEVLRLDGHVVDSLVLAKVLDLVVDSGATYRILEMEIGTTRRDPSHVRIEVTASSEESLEALFASLHVHGANREDAADALLVPAERDGVLPEGFYATTNLPTRVRLGGRWTSVESPEMDCAVVVEPDSEGAAASARIVPMHRVRRGDMVVVGSGGVRVDRPTPRGCGAGAGAGNDEDEDEDGDEGELGSLTGGGSFGFMTSDVSSEKPKALSVERVAGALRSARSRREHRSGRQEYRSPGGGPDRGADRGADRVLVVAGPAVVHTGAAPALAGLVRDGWVQVFFAGNGFATHDVESAVLGTSLGVPLAGGRPAEHGHANHLRVINELRRYGSIEAAVQAGWLASGVLYECVKAGVPFVLAGSIRDDGPIPDVVTDTLQAADAMREQVAGVGVAIMLASTLHAIATGNLLPAGVETFCVDINQAVVTKLADRGSHQAMGIVTDVGLFVSELAAAVGALPVPSPT